MGWRRNWSEVIPFFAFPEAVRRIIYTTNAIESLNAKLRKAVRARGHFPNDDAALKLLFLVLSQTAKDWKMPPCEWTEEKKPFRHYLRRKVLRKIVAKSAPHTRFLTLPEAELCFLACRLLIQPAVRIGDTCMGFVRGLLFMEIRADTARAIVRLEASLSSPSLNKCSIHREVLARQQRLHIGMVR